MNHFITLPEAIEMTSRYRAEYNDLLKPEYQNQGLLPLSESFERSAIDALLAQEGCVGIRIYGGMTIGKVVHAVLVGYDANGADILPSTASTLVAEEDDVIVDHSIRCPPECPPSSPLNS